jgi:VWFA-related protein
MIKSTRACLAVFLSLPAIAFAQQTVAAAQAGAVPAPSTPEGRIKLDVLVTDKSGKPVSGLDLKDFTLLDNNQPAKILSFHASDGTPQGGDPPVEVILLIDTVNLEFKYVISERQEVEKFLSQNGGHLAQPVSLFAFTNVGLDAARAPSTDGNGLAAEVAQLDNKLRTIGPSTGVNGAIERYYASIKAVAAMRRVKPTSLARSC